jgi:hypothetical protein
MKEENVRVIGPMMFNTENVNFIESRKKVSKVKIAEDAKTTRNKILGTIKDCFQNKIDNVAEGGRQVGLTEKEIWEVLAPVSKLLEAYSASTETKAHTITVLIETMLTIILMAPERLQDFAESVQMSFQKIAMDEIIRKVENIKEEK